MKTFFIKKKIEAENIQDAMMRESAGTIVEVFEESKPDEKNGAHAVGFAI